MSAVEVHGVFKSFGDRSVLEKINIAVPSGGFCTLVGASGCGKTTFLRMLLGVEEPTHGTITVDGATLHPEPGPDRGIVFQRYSVFPHLSVIRNVILGLEFLGAPVTGHLTGQAKRQALARGEAVLESVGLSHVRNAMPSQLSGGMQQRLAIAQALILEPRILLLDEPFGALDPGIRNDMHELMIGLWRQTGMTVFMVTHDLKEAFKLGTRVLTFDKIRHDPQEPDAFGATITYDLPGHNRRDMEPSEEEKHAT